MASTTDTRRIVCPLLALNFVMYLLVLGFASWSLNKYINGRAHPHLSGNCSTTYFLMFCLPAGVTGICSILAATLHIRAWRNDSLPAAATSAMISWAFTAVSFGFAIKEISLGNRGNRLKTLEAFIIILTRTQLLYAGLLHAGIVSRKYGPGYRDHGAEYGVMDYDQQKPTHPVV